MESVKCDACGKELVVVGDNDATIRFVAVSINVSTDAKDELLTKAARISLGEYQLNKEYNICYECWLKSLGVKPPERSAPEGMDAQEVTNARV